ncbi:hypothetical protein HYC85_006522 [Camellia sinensis]|uniref:DEX1 C-terminal domain-containing protein n=1 Tax=Camellia sinensis TaxID=4442 RepID=A0A7J7HNV1_CAMSI|nr:hypothetical protein HYC85_006522 [Camellia sinensis]
MEEVAATINLELQQLQQMDVKSGCAVRLCLFESDIISKIVISLKDEIVIKINIVCIEWIGCVYRNSPEFIRISLYFIDLMKTSSVFLISLLVFASLGSIHGISESESEGTKKNKFREREATDDALGYPNLDEDELLNAQCPQHLELRWQTEVSSSVYATPLIADINSDGKLDIVVSSFVHYLEVLEGSDGDKMPGWPAFHQSTVHSSPLLYDIDKDGVREIALATYNGEVLFFRVSGYMMSDKLEIPRLKVKKDWHVGLRADPVDRSHPDVHDESLVQEAVMNSIRQTNGSATGSGTSNLTTPADLTNTVNASNLENQGKFNDSQVDAGIKLPTSMDNSTLDSGSSKTSNAENGTNSRRRLLEDAASKGSEVGGSDSKASNGDIHAATVENDQGLEADADSSFELLRDSDELADEYSYDYDDYVDENMWGDEEWTETDHENLEDFVNVDSHILCTPVIADIDNDGVSEMVIAVSYFFDHESSLQFLVKMDLQPLMLCPSMLFIQVLDLQYYDNPEHLKELGGIDIGKYVAGGIVVFNLDTKQVKWTAQLDLSTDTGKFRAYVYSSPTVVDLDGDGNLDILVGTSYGLFYVFDHKVWDVLIRFCILFNNTVSIIYYYLDYYFSKTLKPKFLTYTIVNRQASHPFDTHRASRQQSQSTHTKPPQSQSSLGSPSLVGHHRASKLREKFPLEMAEIQGAVVAADINDDGKIELVTTDTHGNVAAWTAQGKEIWERHLKSLVPQGASVGDVDGDGHTDVVVPTLSGNVYVLSGKDGSDIRPYPYRTHGRVMNQQTRGEKEGLTIVTTSFDGYLYLIDGPTSCADVVDIGETSYSMVLADNVDGGDDLDLVVATMNGNAWRVHNQGRNNVANRFNRQGIYISPSSRAFRDEEGKNFWVEIEIIDKYRFPSGSQAPYNVTTTLLVPGNYQGERTMKQNKIFDRAGKYKIKLPTVGVRTTGTVLVEMVDKNGLHFSDEFSLTFHMYYYKLLKWLLVLPMLGMFGVLVILRPQEAMPLPSFSRNTDL